jgi:hypothetical protein
MANEQMPVRFTQNERNAPAGKLADAEIHFHDGPLAGLKLMGFSLWARRKHGTEPPAMARSRATLTVPPDMLEAASRIGLWRLH